MTKPKFNVPEPDSKSGMQCMCCESSDLIQGVTVLDQTDRGELVLNLGKDWNPSTLVFKGRQRSHTMAVVRGTCGFVHLFATSPAALKAVGGG